MSSSLCHFSMPPTPKDLPLVTVGWGGLFLNINNDVLLTKTIHILNEGIDCTYILLSTKLHIPDYSVW